MGHTEISQSPCKGGGHGQGIIVAGRTFGHIVSLKDIEEAGKIGNIGKNVIESADNTFAEAEHDKQSNCHNDALYEIGKGGGKKSAQCAVNYDYGGADYHGGHIVYSEKGGEQLSAGTKSRCGIWDEKDYDDYGRDAGQHLFPVAETAGEKVGNGVGIDAVAVYSESFSYKQPVEICTDRKPRRRPEGFGHTGHKGKAGHTHKQPAAHIRGFGTHGRYQRAELSSS